MHALIPLFFAEDRGPTVRALRSLYPLVSPDAPVTDVHVAMVGRWEGHPSGPFELTRESFAEIVRNFDRNPNPVPLDFEHATVGAPEAPACGWVQSLSIRDDDDGRAHLWARVELGEKAARYIREGAYRFSSGVFVFGAIDNATGADIGVEMTSLALTNVPFIQGQTPIALSRRAAQSRAQTRFLTRSRDTMKVKKEALLAALGSLEMDELSPAEVDAAMGMAAAQSGALGEESEPEAMADEVKPEDEEELPAEMAATSDAPAPAEPVQAAEPMGEGPAAAALAPLMEATGLDMPALAAAISEKLEAVAAALMGALEQPAAPAPLSEREASLALSARDTVIRALRAKNETLEAALSARETAEADAEIGSLIDGGIAPPEMRDDLRALRATNRSSFDRIVATLSQRPHVPLGGHASATKRTADPADVSIDEASPLVVALRRQLTGAGLGRAAQDDLIKRQLAAK